MNRVLSGIVVMIFLIVGPTAEAQRAIGVGVAGGVSVPVSALRESHKTGYNAEAHVGVDIPLLPVAFRLEGFYNRLEPTAIGIIGGGDIRIVGGSANLLYCFTFMGIRPYAIGGVGIYQVKYVAGSPVDIGYNGGLGAEFQFSGLRPFIEARLHTISDERRFRFVPVTLGLDF
jgi:hypothetical protein